MESEHHPNHSTQQGERANAEPFSWLCHPPSQVLAPVFCVAQAPFIALLTPPPPPGPPSILHVQTGCYGTLPPSTGSGILRTADDAD